MKSEAEARIGVPEGSLHDRLPLTIGAGLVSFSGYCLCSCVDMGDTVVVGLKGASPASVFRIYDGTHRGSTFVTGRPVGFLLRRNYSTLSLDGFIQSRVETPYDSGKSVAAFIDDYFVSGIKSDDVLSIYLVLRGHDVRKIGFRGGPDKLDAFYMATYDLVEEGKYRKYGYTNRIVWELSSVKEINVDNPIPFAL